MYVIFFFLHYYIILFNTHRRFYPIYKVVNMWRGLKKERE